MPERFRRLRVLGHPAGARIEGLLASRWLEASPFCARRADDERQYRDIDADAGSTRVAEGGGVGGRWSGPGSHVMGSVGPCLMVFIPICDRALLTPGSAARRLV